MHPYYIRKLQLWRLATYLFAHATTFHIFCNMWAVFLFGRGLERVLGCRRFLTLYFISGIIGALCWCLVNWNVETAAIASKGITLYKIPLSKIDEAVEAGYKLLRIEGGCVGASGSVFGLLVATALAFPDVRIQLLFPPVAMKMRTFAIIYIVIEILSLFDKSSNVAHIAHLGGALGGFIYMRRLCPNGSFLGRLFRRRRRPAMRVISNDDLDDAEAAFLSSPEVARVLKKLSQVGHDGLTEEEKILLARVARIMNNQMKR
ncbi:MAG: rhomboid family intramembrane serine protease [Victivallales bacterium]|nr:rhomboid family intramembrane serine protease [Victivallales bacterium]